MGQLTLMGAGPGAPGGFAARYGLVSAWNMDEASGDRADAFGANNLIDVNTVTTAVAKLGAFAAQFISAQSEYLGIASNASLQTGNLSWWLSLWIYLDTVAGMDIYSKYGASNSASELEIVISISRAKVIIYNSTSGTAAVSANTFGNLSAGQYYHLFVCHDDIADLLKIAVNDGVFDTVSTAGFAYQTTAAPVNFGSYNNGGAGGFFNGRIDAAKWGKFAPGSADGALLDEIKAYEYNGGAGRQYPQDWT